MIKCAIIGGSKIMPHSRDSIALLQRWGEWCAKHHIVLLTGACSGYPYVVGKACVAKGGKVIGYSPARDLDEHVEEYENPVDGCSVIRYLDNPINDKDQRLMLRSFPLVEDADVIVSVGGNWGTLFELTASVIGGKHVLVLTDTRGISGGFEMLYDYMESNCAYAYGEQVEFISATQEVRDRLLEICKEKEEEAN